MNEYNNNEVFNENMNMQNAESSSMFSEIENAAGAETEYTTEQVQQAKDWLGKMIRGMMLSRRLFIAFIGAAFVICGCYCIFVEGQWSNIFMVLLGLLMVFAGVGPLRKIFEKRNPYQSLSQKQYSDDDKM